MAEWRPLKRVSRQNKRDIFPVFCHFTQPSSTAKSGYATRRSVSDFPRSPVLCEQRRESASGGQANGCPFGSFWASKMNVKKIQNFEYTHFSPSHVIHIGYMSHSTKLIIKVFILKQDGQRPPRFPGMQKQTHSQAVFQA